MLAEAKRFQACSNRIPYSGDPKRVLHFFSFKPVQTGFPIQAPKQAL